MKGSIARFYGIQPKDVKERDLQYLSAEANKEYRPIPTPKIDPT